MKKILSEISLRNLTAVIVGLLVLVALAFAVGKYRDSRVESHNAQLMVERNDSINACLSALDEFFAERGRALTYLFGAVPISGEHRVFLDQRRRAGDDHVAHMLARMTDRDSRQAGEARRAWERLKEYRPVVDEALTRVRGQRDPAIPERWLAMSNDTVLGLLRLMNDLAGRAAVEDAGFAQLDQLRRSTVLLRTMIGAESAVFGMNAGSGRPVSDKEIVSLRLTRAQAAVVWEGLEQGLTKIGDARTLELLEQARSGLLDGLRKRHEEILLTAERDIPAAADEAAVRDHVRMVAAAMDNVGALSADIARLADGYTQGRVAQTRTKERLALLGIALTLVFGGLAFFVFVVRVGRPLQAIQQRVDSLLARHSSGAQEDNPSVVGDECKRIDFALKLLEDAMVARDRVDRDLRKHERVSASILAAVPQSVIATDSRGTITLFSPGAEAMLGYSAAEMIGKETPLRFHDREEVRKRARDLTEELGVPVAEGFPAFVAKAQATGLPDEREWTFIRKDGSRLTVLLSVTVFNDDQGEMLCCGVATDVTERSQIAAEMSRLANYDPLTQLPNRRLFRDRMRMALIQARRENTFMALLMIDLDRFKPVNDEYGHSVGDLLLGATAARMQKCLRESDTLARVGGDEFVVILSMIGGVGDAVGVADKIRQSLSAPFELTGDINVGIDCSIGVAVYPDHGNSEDALLKNADNAMYVAKALGRAQVHVSGGNREDGMVRAASENIASSALVWRRSYQCGDPSIDREHKDLFAHGNTLIRAVANGRIPLEKLPEMLDELIESVMAHFRNEEFILSRYGYGNVEEHARKHQKLVKRALELRSMAVAGELSLADVVSFVTRDVVAQHMLIDDHDYYPLLRKTSQRNVADLP